MVTVEAIEALDLGALNPPGNTTEQRVFWLGQYMVAKFAGLGDPEQVANQALQERLRLLEREQMEATEKHLPGRHDQQTHTPHIYATGTPVTREWLEDGGSEYVAELQGEYKEIVIATLEHAQVAQEDLEGLAGFTMDPPPDEVYIGAGVFFNVEQGVMSYGAYDTWTGKIHLSPVALKDVSARGVVIHEVGHHVLERAEALGPRRVRASAMSDRLRRETGGDEARLAEFGLRSNSLRDPYEFMADVYLADHLARPEQRENLASFFGGFGIDIQDVYKQLGAVVNVRELRSERSDNLIRTVGVPVEADQSIVDKVPWYYVKETSSNV